MGGRQASRPVWLALIPVLLTAVILALVTAGCSGSASVATGDDAAATPKQGGTYNYPLAVDPGSFDPSIAQTIDGWAVLHQLYEGLVRWEEQPDGTMKTVPCLAESWSGNADATVWTFELRRGVMFQAPVSREVTAADVVADLQYLADPAHEFQMTFTCLHADQGDERERRFDGRPRSASRPSTATPSASRSKHPFSEFLDTLGNPAFWVWPVDHLRKVGLRAYARHPVGTGPYRFQRQVTGTSIDLVRNPTGGTPPADRTSTLFTTRCSAASRR